MKSGASSGPRPHLLDLFGEVPVTWPEIWAWLEAVPGISRDSWRAGYYLKFWDVPAKIRAAKLAGCFDEIIARTGRPALPDPGRDPAE